MTEQQTGHGPARQSKRAALEHRAAHLERHLADLAKLHADTLAELAAVKQHAAQLKAESQRLHLLAERYRQAYLEEKARAERRLR